MTLREFYDLLKKHDWYYDMSEDPKVVLTGRINRQKLIKLSRQSPEHEKLFEEYRAYMFSGPAWYTAPAPKPKRPKE